MGAAGAGRTVGLVGGQLGRRFRMGMLTAPPVKLDPLAPVPARADRRRRASIRSCSQKAKAALDSRPWIRDRDFIGIVDFSQRLA